MLRKNIRWIFYKILNEAREESKRQRSRKQIQMKTET